jgi:ribonuclease VapC
MRQPSASLVVVDTSAIVAIVGREPTAALLQTVLAEAGRRELSAANLVETGAVISRRGRDPAAALASLDRLLAELDIAVTPFDAAQARVAMTARLRFGKGHGHPAKLNLGDTYAYALASVRNAPLLFVGEDFARTDVTPALP